MLKLRKNRVLLAIFATMAMLVAEIGFVMILSSESEAAYNSRRQRYNVEDYLRRKRVERGRGFASHCLYKNDSLLTQGKGLGNGGTPFMSRFARQLRNSDNSRASLSERRRRLEERASSKRRAN